MATDDDNDDHCVSHITEGKATESKGKQKKEKQSTAQHRNAQANAKQRQRKAEERKAKESKGKLKMLMIMVKMLMMAKQRLDAGRGVTCFAFLNADASARVVQRCADLCFTPLNRRSRGA